MKNNNRVALFHFLTFLVCLCAAFSLSSCSRKRDNPVPIASVKMEGQSANWKVVVVALKKVTTQLPVMDPTQIRGTKDDVPVLELSLDIEYRGPGSEVQSPVPTVVDDKGKTFKSVLVSIELPKGSEKDFDSPAVKELNAVMEWLSPVSNDSPKRRMIQTGKKLAATISFEDPKQYTNLKLTFGDVPPILLRVPADEKHPD